MAEKRIRTTDSPAAIPTKLANTAGAFSGEKTSPVSSKSNASPLAAAISKVKVMMEGKEGPEWAMIQLLLGALEQTQAENAELHRTISKQQTEIARLNAVVASPVTIVDAEEKERRRSIVVSGLPEIAGKPSERRAADKERLHSLVDELDVDVDVTAAYRMGEKKGDRPRLLKVVLGSSKHQQSLLRGCGKLKTSPNFGGVFVRPSLTKEQRQEDFVLRTELRRRRALGEKVRIVGWPGEVRKIVTLSENC